MLPRGLGGNFIEPLFYSLIILCFSQLFCWLVFQKTARKKMSFADFLIIFLINFLIFSSCLIADLVRGWEFLTFAVVFYPLVFLIDSFFILLKMRLGKGIVGWGLIFFFLFLFVIYPLIVLLRKNLWGLPKY